MIHHPWAKGRIRMIQPTTDELVALTMVMTLLIVAWKKSLLDHSGLIAALIVGLLVSILGHWTWLAILVFFLIIGSISTSWRYEEKQRLHLEEENEGMRGWRNVVANGGVASMIAIINYSMGGLDWAYFAAASSISVAAADTLASEIGSLDPRTRSIINLEAVPAGTNGGMSITGSFAALGGGILIAIIATTLSSIPGEQISMSSLFLAVAIIGWLGCQVDSILGALFENKGYIGKHTVNFIATLSGALMALIANWYFL